MADAIIWIQPKKHWILMIDLNLLKDLYKINSYSGEEEKIRQFLLSYLKKHYTGLKIRVDKVGNIYVTKGKAKYYPCMAAHIDQVGKYKGQIFIFRHNNIMIGIGEHGQQVNLGADDKNGVWIALQMLKYEPVFKCAFFVGEEVGCIGSSSCDMSFFDNAKYVIQCDRRNGGDFINETYSTELCGDDFVSEELKAKYGYKNTYGMMTDVETLKERGLKVACCNMSCGYYNPHHDNEFTNVKELINCLNFVREIVRITPLVKHEDKGVYSKMGWRKGCGSYYGYSGYGGGLANYSDYYGWNIYD